MFNWNKKEKPLLGLQGSGGGLGFLAPKGGGGPSHSASGATIFDVESNGRFVIQFNTPGSITFTESMSSKDLRIILVGGGGGGSPGNAGGGGAGGMMEITASTLGAGTYPVSIGDGGAAGPFPGNRGSNGSNSTFGPGLTANGGGGGGTQGDNAYVGGSGGGGGYGRPGGNANQPGVSIPGTYTGTNYGSAGTAHISGYACGGGGGAGSSGNWPSPEPAAWDSRRGGQGRTVPAPNFPGVPFSGQLVAGGGGGSDRYNNGRDTGGPGGGGSGCSCGDAGDGPSYPQTDPACTSSGNNGTANTGGGGGGSRCSPSHPGHPPGTGSGSGGKGLCIVSYS